MQIQLKKGVENHVKGTIASQKYRLIRKDLELQLFIQSMKSYINDPFFVAGIMLYEAEGSKGSSNGFSNSDYRVIKVYIKFLIKYLKLNPDKNLTYRLYIHEIRKDDLQRILNFWSNKLGVKIDNINVSWKHNIVTKKRINLNYVGQFEVRVRKYPNFTGKLLSISDIILTKYQH